MIRRTLISICALIVLGTVVAVAAANQKSDVSHAKKATARFHRVAAARAAGYTEFRDARGIACIDNPGVGGMGIHFVNQKLVGDPRVDVRRPEAVIYEPLAHGKRRLVAVEYIVVQSAWDANHHVRPRLYGRTFELTPAGNRYGLPPFYELHAWLWKHNSRGMFDDWNPRVSCPAAA